MPHNAAQTHVLIGPGGFPIYLGSEAQCYARLRDPCMDAPENLGVGWTTWWVDGELFTEFDRSYREACRVVLAPRAAKRRAS